MPKTTLPLGSPSALRTLAFASVDLTQDGRGVRMEDTPGLGQLDTAPVR